MIEPTWQAGDVKLYLGDCLEILPQLEAGSVDAVVTDPPYGVDKAEWDNNVFPLLGDAAKECSRILKNEGICFWFSSTRYLPETINAVASIPFKWMFIWYPSNNMAHGDLGFQKFTPVLVLSHSKAWRNMQDLREIPIRTDEGNGHPTVKPLRLMTYLTKYSCKEDDTILDPFMGSGTTGVACVQTGRKFIGIEIEPKYFEIAVKRISEAQKQIRMPI